QPRLTAAGSTHPAEHPVHIFGEPAHERERAHREQLLRMAPEETRQSELAPARQSTTLGTPFETAFPLFRSFFDSCFSHVLFSLVTFIATDLPDIRTIGPAGLRCGCLRRSRLGKPAEDEVRLIGVSGET